ncbi:hypothetical protein E3N88_26540 [Mikania micrantha]|uniref:PGG domain-containing protein n=1 Tax=Mikania micrantha TaxID=192012 RepID=A0A5N6MU28_9ASTR|nr:hypothetical protein E3N88_26540 [Mikania micrantha]
MELKKKEYEDAKKLLQLVFKHIRGKEHADDISIRKLYSRPILEAACQDAYDVVDEILEKWPEAIMCKDEKGHNIIQLATMHRSLKIYNLIYTFKKHSNDDYGTMEDSSKNNMLHLAGRLAPLNKLKRHTGAALQLQSELQWQQEVEKIMFPPYVTRKNIFEETPEMVFTREHENLVQEGEKWIKAVAESCSITAALITTIVFAAAITVPGGSSQKGVPVFTNEIAFLVFALSDAISLFTSVTALLVFLSILTSRFSEQDFLDHLPKSLFIGLCTLLISTTAMMVAFGATLFLVFCHQKFWVIAPIGGLAVLPIAFFIVLQFPLVLDLFRSTCISRFGKLNLHNSKFNPSDLKFFFDRSPEFEDNRLKASKSEKEKVENGIEPRLRIVDGLTTGLNVSPQSTPTCCVLPSHTKRALYHSKEPSDLAIVGLEGMGAMVVVFKFNGCICLEMPFMARVRMVLVGIVGWVGWGVVVVEFMDGFWA